MKKYIESFFGLVILMLLLIVAFKVANIIFKIVLYIACVFIAILCIAKVIEWADRL